MIEICTVGGFSEVGKNMTAIKVDDEVIICDMGFFLPEIIRLQDEEVVKEKFTKKNLIQYGAIPNDEVIKKWKDKVKAIVVTHCHLDHIGAIPYMAEQYKAPVIGTPYSIEVLKAILKDEKIRIKNKLKTLNSNAKVKISDKITIEFVNMTHSTPQTVMIAIHTPYGAIIYANDFKFDNHPVIGKKPNYKRLKEIGKKGVIALIADALYSDANMKTPSEKVARELLKDVLLGINNKDHLVIVTTFASQIARLKSIIEFGKKMNRKIIFLGRSLQKYVTAAENIKLVNFTKDVELVGFASQVRKKLKEIQKNPKKYLIVCTGNQGEPRAVLTRLALSELPYNFKPGDHVVFSCRVIPAPINIANRTMLEEKLKEKGIRIFRDIHSSGHAAREDLRDLIHLVKPKHVFPAHGDITKLTPMAELARELGYEIGKDVHLMRDGQFIKIE
ncbi:ribonuclease J [archaeon]|nr:ribonuclease J [archaeon]